MFLSKWIQMRTALLFLSGVATPPQHVNSCWSQYWQMTDDHVGTLSIYLLLSLYMLSHMRVSLSLSLSPYTHICECILFNVSCCCGVPPFLLPILQEDYMKGTISLMHFWITGYWTSDHFELVKMPDILLKSIWSFWSSILRHYIVNWKILNF